MRGLVESLRGYKEVLTWNVLLISISSVFMAFAMAFYQWLYPLLVYGEGGQALVAFSFTAIYVVSAIFAPIGGVIADVRGRGIALVVFTAMYPAAFLAMLLGGAYGLVAGGIILTVASAAAGPAAVALVGESVPQDKVGRAFSLWSSLALAGSIAGSAVIGYLASLDVRQVLLLCAALTAGALAIRALLRETARGRGGRRPALSALRSAASLWKIRLGMLLATYNAVWSMGGGIITIYFPIFVREVLGLSYVELGVVYAVMSAVKAAWTPLAGALVDRLGSFPALMATTAGFALIFAALAALPYLGLSSSTAFPAVLAISVLAMLVEGMGDPATDRLYIDVTRQESRGTVISALMATSNVGRIPSPALGALLWGTASSLAMLMPSAFALFALPFLYTTWRLWRRGERL